MSVVYRTNLSSSKISDELKAMPDYLFYEQQMPAATSVERINFTIGGTQGQLELVIVVAETIEIADSTVTSFTLLTDEDKDGDFNNSIVLYSKTAVGAETIEAGEVIVRRIPNTETEIFGRLRFTTTDSQETGRINAYLRRVVA